MKKLSAVLLLLCAGYFSYAQSDSTGKRWQISLSVDLTTVPAINVEGTDTSFINTLSYAPVLSLRSVSGWGIVYSPAFTAGSATPGVYVHALTAGYEQYDQQNYNLVANFIHFFFTANPSVPYTPITNEIYSTFAYKKSVIRPVITAGGGFGVSKDSTSSHSAYDLGVAAGLGHAFNWQGNGTSFSLVPSLLLNAGTNQYFSLMTVTRYIAHTNRFTSFVTKGSGSTSRGTGGGRGRGTRGTSSAGATSGTSSGSGSTFTTTQQSVSNSESFSIRNAELNVEGELEAGHWAFRPAGSLYLPLGISAGSGLFGYGSLTVQYNF